MLVIGDQEMEANAIALRKRSGENLGAMEIAKFVELAQKEVAEHI